MFKYLINKITAKESNDTLKDLPEKHIATNVTLINLPD